MRFNDAVAAEIRAELARQQLSGVRAAKSLGWTQNYISARLRGVVPLSLDDLQAIADLLEVPVTKFFEVTGTDVRTPGSCPPELEAAA
jgi:transcriptional regulator with XRE-family HTH domain